MSTDMEPERRTIHRVAGVIYEPLDRRAIIVGSGLEVFEVVMAYEAAGHDWEELREGFHWLTEEQLRAALLLCCRAQILPQGAAGRFRSRLQLLRLDSLRLIRLRQARRLSRHVR